MNGNAEPDDLAGDADLRALYRRLPADEPGAPVDAAIHAAALRAVQESQRQRRLWPVLRWSVPLAAAAGAVLVLVVERPDLLPRSDTAPKEFARSDQVAAAPEAAAPAAAAPTRAAPPAAPAPAKESGSFARAQPAAPQPAAPQLQEDEAPPAGRSRGIMVVRWPFGLSPDLAPESACAGIPAALATACSAAADGRGLVVTIAAVDADAFARAWSAACTQLGWERSESDERKDEQRWRHPGQPGVLRVERSGAAFTLRIAGSE